MGGVDKGLQLFNGQSLALHTALRLQAQLSVQPSCVVVNANRNIATYESLPTTVWPDAVPDAFEGPLAGFLTGLQRCSTEYLLTVPCDTPLFPLDLAQRLLTALHEAQADIAMVSAPEPDGPDASQTPEVPETYRLRAQPVFCLMRLGQGRRLAVSLEAFMQSGQRKIDTWTAQHHTVLVPFDRSTDDPHAFANANTLTELQALQRQ
jgi:molybdenum cofactor guanylyltransferase